MRAALQKRDADGNEGLARSLQQLYKTRLQDTSGNLTFDVQTYLWHVHQWNNAVSSVDRMTTALLVLREQCRDADAKLRNGWQQKHKEGSSAFVEDMKTKFLGDLGLWPSTKALVDAASVDNGKQFPQVFELRDGAGRPMFIEDVYIVPFGAEQGYYVYGFKEDVNNRSTPVSRAFAFEYQGALWHIKANRAIQRSSDSLFFGRWEKLRDDSEDYPLVKSWGS